MLDNRRICYEGPETFYSLKIFGFSKYMLSTHGRVKTVNSGYTTKGSLDVPGYYRVKLVSDSGGKNKFYIHRLMGYLFIGQPYDENYTIDHIDRNRDNNHINNLYWATKSEQALNRKERKFVKGLWKPVTRINLNGEEDFTFFNIKDAANSVNCNSYGYFTAICRNNSIYGGYKWKYEQGMIDNEKWVKIDSKEYYPIYVSDKGRVAIFPSLDEDITKVKIGFGSKDAHGYRIVRVKMLNDSKRKAFRVHRLIMWGFYGKNIKFVNHIDSNKKNNKLENLNYMTAAENTQHSVQSGTFHSNSRISWKIRPVMQYTLDGVYVTTFSSLTEAAKQLGLSSGFVSQVCKGTKKSRKYILKYAEKENYED